MAQNHSPGHGIDPQSECRLCAAAPVALHRLVIRDYRLYSMVERRTFAIIFAPSSLDYLRFKSNKIV